MSYEPQEGVDYIIDLYQVIGVEPDAHEPEIKQAINKGLREYHPDRLEGLAPEFRHTGERKSQLLNRASAILLDSEKRAQYDEVLNEWDGLVSKDGAPMITIPLHNRAMALRQTNEELEADFVETRTKIEQKVGLNRAHAASIAEMYENASEENKRALGDLYEAALLAEDRVLGIEEANRGELIGLVINPRYQVSAGYGEKIPLAIEGVKTQTSKDYVFRVLGGSSVKLAILSGEEPDKTAQEDMSGTLVGANALPHYFASQAERIKDIAAAREAILEKRLALIEPQYPIHELQIDAQPSFAVGIINYSDPSKTAWIKFTFDPTAMNLSTDGLDDETLALLESGEYGSVYARGYNILTYVTKEQIDDHTLLEHIYTTHLTKYYPELFED